VHVLVVNPHPIWAQRIGSRLASAGATVSVVSDPGGVIASLDEAWPDVLVIEHRFLEAETAQWVAAFKDGETLPLIVPTALAHLRADRDEISLRGEDTLQRLETLVTRLQGVFEFSGQQPIRVGKLTIDTARKEVVFAARRIPLPPSQFHLLLYLALNAPRVVSQTELVREIWGYAESEGDPRELIKTHVRQIRRKLGWSDHTNNYLQSVRGFGYVLGPPPEEPTGETPE
jgi:DNA-binding response OmpR family regulator